MNIIDTLEKEEMARLGKTVPDFAPGDTVIVNVNVVEGERKRVQAYEGVVIAKRNRGLNSSFVVRKISSGEGVERSFQTYSPLIASIEVKRKGDVRRAKLYYLRDRSGKSARIREKLAHREDKEANSPGGKRKSGQYAPVAAFHKRSHREDKEANSLLASEKKAAPAAAFFLGRRHIAGLPGMESRTTPGRRFCRTAASSAAPRCRNLAFCGLIIDNLHCPAVSRNIPTSDCEHFPAIGDEGNALRGTGSTAARTGRRGAGRAASPDPKILCENTRRPRQRRRGLAFHQSCQPHTQRSRA